jgi:hypothetical protein
VELTYQGASLLLSVIVFMVVPLIVAVIRSNVRWSKVEGKVDTVIRDLDRMVKSQEKLVEDKDKVHSAMLDTIRDDRRATDRRLRWLEENLWKKVP